VADHLGLQTLVGIVAFGNVARGEADRRSDIDALVIVDGESNDRQTGRLVSRRRTRRAPVPTAG
jgi:predicted nucleotidyltransferase